MLIKRNYYISNAVTRLRAGRAALALCEFAEMRAVTADQ
jgi:hypothetical protein